VAFLKRIGKSRCFAWMAKQALSSEISGMDAGYKRSVRKDKATNGRHE
jgi:hypothetical protein